MSLYLTDGKSTPGQVMAWCHQQATHYLNQCRPSSVPPYSATIADTMSYSIDNDWSLATRSDMLEVNGFHAQQWLAQSALNLGLGLSNCTPDYTPTKNMEVIKHACHKHSSSLILEEVSIEMTIVWFPTLATHMSNVQYHANCISPFLKLIHILYSSYWCKLLCCIDATVLVFFFKSRATYSYKIWSKWFCEDMLIVKSFVWYSIVVIYAILWKTHKKART